MAMLLFSSHMMVVFLCHCLVDIIVHTYIKNSYEI